jgi:transmembrane sensor
MVELHTLEDFLQNDLFLEWFESPNEQNSAYWRKWMDENPLQRPVFESAVATMALLEGKQPDLSEHYIRQKVRGMMVRMHEPEPRHWFTARRWLPSLRWAAAVVLAAGLGWFLLKPDDAPLANKTTHFDPQTTEGGKRYVNNGDQPLLVNLPDGSSVVLTRGSQIEFDFFQETSGRKVFLSGEGFFEVTKDPSRPFFVYTKHLMTKVLGTSFLVRSFDSEPKTTVAVRSGAVSVVPQKRVDKSRTALPDTFLLKPNEQISLEVATHELTAEKWPENGTSILPERLRVPTYHFKLTPVTEIFTLLEETYGVTIQYNREKFKNCTLTATFSDEPFLDKIKLICVGIEADFQMSGSYLTITGDGCSSTDLNF